MSFTLLDAHGEIEPILGRPLNRAGVEELVQRFEGLDEAGPPAAVHRVGARCRSPDERLGRGARVTPNRGCAMRGPWVVRPSR